MAAPVRSEGELRATFVAAEPVIPPVAGRVFRVWVLVQNTGTETWRQEEQVRVSYHWLRPDGSMAHWEGRRTELPHDVAPGETLDALVQVDAPAEVGAMVLELDMMQENRAWFANLDPASAYRLPLTISAPPPLVQWRAIETAHFPLLLRLIALAVLLAGHWCSCAALLVRWSHPDGVEDRVFDITLLGLASLLALLQLLLFTIGLSFGRVLVLFALAHGLAWLLATRTPPVTRMAPPQHPWRWLVEHLPGILGCGLGAFLLLTWAFYMARSYDSTGTDVAQYHLPYALSYAQGRTPWGLAATDAHYPQGNSVLAALLLLATDSLLLGQLTHITILPLLAASLAVLLREAGVVRAWNWAPWGTLALLAMPMMSGALTLSADLPYAVATIALFVMLWRIWRQRTLSTRNALLLAAAAGYVLASKSNGPFTLGLGVALLGAALLARWLVCREGLQWPKNRRLALGGSAVALFLLGGVWLLRNCAVWGSPLSPMGMRLGKTWLFVGYEPALMRHSNSVLYDLLHIADYDYPARFLHYAQAWFAPWIGWLPPLALAMAIVDAAQLAWQGSLRHDAATLKTRLGLAVAALLFAAPHSLVFPGLPWTSLENYGGLSLRYLLPFFLLVGVTLGAQIFLLSLRWQERPWVATAVALGLLAATLWGWRATRFWPSVFLAARQDASVPLAAATALAGGLWLWRRMTLKPRLRQLASGLIVCLTLLVIGIWANTATAADVRARASLDQELTVLEQRFAVTGEAPNTQRGLYLAACLHQREMGTTGMPLRFYTRDVIFFPLEFTGASFADQTLDLWFPSQFEGRAPALLGRVQPWAGFDPELPARIGSDYVVSRADRPAPGVTPGLAALLNARGLGLEPVRQVGNMQLWALAPIGLDAACPQ
jgi:hypothetical protein